MEEINQNSQTFLDFNRETFEPKNENEIQEIIKYCFKKKFTIRNNWKPNQTRNWKKTTVRKDS